MPPAQEGAPQPMLVIGGTRGTGKLIVERLCAASSPVRVLARDPVRAGRVLPATADVVKGDLTHRDSLLAATRSVAHIVFTAGCRSGYPATESRVRAVEYEGVLSTLAAAVANGFAGRFLYMTSIGVDRPSVASRLLNLYKGNALRWRRRAEDAIRASGLDYVTIRAGFLLNGEGGRRELRVSQEALPLQPSYRITRSDVADVLLACLGHPATTRATFELVFGSGVRRTPIATLLDQVRQDRASIPGGGDEHA